MDWDQRLIRSLIDPPQKKKRDFFPPQNHRTKLSNYWVFHGEIPPTGDHDSA